MTPSEFYTFLISRQSASTLVEPKPDPLTLEKILNVGGTVPDHGGLKPYRFVVVQDAGRDKFADAMVNAAEEVKGPIEDKLKAKIKSKAFAAPLQLVIIFSPIANDKIPDWEQMASASCTGYALGLAANALGFGAVWKSFAFEPGSLMKKTFRLTESERVLGWINIGTEKDRDRSPRPQLDMSKYSFHLQ